MNKREKVKKGLDLCLTGKAACEDCPYDAECKEARGIGPSPLRRDALELLKEQEAVEPIMVDHIVFGTNRKCSKCNMYLFPAARYCPHCGRLVKLDGMC